MDVSPDFVKELLPSIVEVESRRLENLRVEAARRVPRHLERFVCERLALVVELGQVDVADLPHPLAPRAHAALIDDVADDDAFALALLDGHRAAGLALRDVERKGI